MHRAIITLGQTIGAQATIMSCADSLALNSAILLAAVVLVAMLSKGTTGGGGAHQHRTASRLSPFLNANSSSDDRGPRPDRLDNALQRMSLLLLEGA